MSNPTPREITVWVCDKCDYWREFKTTGVHMVANPDDPNGKLIAHPLHPATFVEALA